MKQIVILSGKGGTGKTSLVAALAHLAAQEARLVLADADVDAANLELLLAPTRIAEHDFQSGVEAVIDEDMCIACGVCEEVCRFDAVAPENDAFRVIANACEGCAACFYQCPVDAISMQECTPGMWFHSQTRYGDLFHAHLFAGQENSGKLVTMVKQQANLWGLDHGADYVVIDGPPGIGCPVIAACAGTHLALLVVEPTVSGVHDLERILATVQHFRVPSAVVINKHDINLEQAGRIAAFCAEQQIPLLGLIPFDTIVTEAMVQGQPVTAFGEGPVTDEIASIWRKLRELLDS